MLITVDELIKMLSTFPGKYPVEFGCPELRFYRLRYQGDKVQLEFNQTVAKDPTTGEIVVKSHV